MYTIENEFLRVGVVSAGAELTSLLNKQTGIEHMWEADPAFWSKRSPVLFPIIGSLKKDTYYFNEKSYSLGRHGFAREKAFQLTEQTPDSLTFLLTDDADTRQHYPFSFRLEIIYQLSTEKLSVTYRVSNPGSESLYFSIGGHPAFRVPMEQGLHYEDYFLDFDQEETAPRWPISAEGLIETEPMPLLKQTKRLPISKSLFMQDALVFKSIRSHRITLGSEKSTHGLVFEYQDFPFLGIWAAKQANFICIEPWCGIADSVNSKQQLTGKEGINMLSPGERFERNWSVLPF